MIWFDHLGVTANTLAEGQSFVDSALGIQVPHGGKHPVMGTHNCLMSLGDDQFFEIIAVDRDASAPDHARWFELDHQKKPPALGAWIVRTNDIETALAKAETLGIDYGEPLQITRGALSWRFAVRADGKIPLEGAAPLIMQWDNAKTHPASTMPDFGFRLDSLNVMTPDAILLSELLDMLELKKKPLINVAEKTILSAVLINSSGTRFELGARNSINPARPGNLN